MLAPFRPIGVVHNVRSAAIDDDWDGVISVIELTDDVPSSSLVGLDAFSHVEVICYAHLAEDVPPAPWHRRPRGNDRWPDVGVFAQRNKDRPNRLLVSTATVLEVGEREVHLRGLDAIDDTPVLDLKPVFSWSGPREALRVAPWSDELLEAYY